MRIISGEMGGRTIQHPGRKVRVTLDNVRETIFNILCVSEEYADVIDLYAGSGSLGIEALSRGAQRCTFVERDRGVAGILQKNLVSLGLVGRSRVIVADLSRRRAHAFLADRTYDLALVDPPYGDRYLAACRDHLVRLTFSPGALVVLEAGSRTAPEIPSGWTVFKERRFGQTKVLFFRRAGVDGSESISNADPPAPTRSAGHAAFLKPRSEGLHV